MERSSSPPPPAVSAEKPKTYPLDTESETEVRALNRSMRAETSERKIPDYTDNKHLIHPKDVTSVKIAVYNKPEQSKEEHPEQKTFTDRRAFFEQLGQNPAVQVNTKKDRPHPSSIAEYETGKLSNSSKWMANPFSTTPHFVQPNQRLATPEEGASLPDKCQQLPFDAGPSIQGHASTHSEVRFQQEQDLQKAT